MRWVGQLYDALMRAVEHMDTREWVFVLGGLVLVGWFCMRGFGSRSSY